MASSSSSLGFHPLKYDVFLNFRGDDTRRGFTSHLYAALRRKTLRIFFDDNDLKRGEEIAQSLPRAIQDSTVAVLVFSKDYVSSSWCLDELAEIIKRHRFHGQIVLPVFYEVDPSHLRKQSHNVAAAFVKHGQNPMNAQKIPRWQDALITAASLCGFDSKNFGNDDLLINKIVEDTLEKLNQSMPRDDFEHLVGMDSRREEIAEILRMKLSKTYILGIWGMGGIGKTTTAEFMYEQMSHQFEGCCFLRNVRQAGDNGVYKLKEDLLSNLLDEKDSVKFRERLARMRVLIVLDDVNTSFQIKFLIGKSLIGKSSIGDSCFGPGSKILITSRNRQVFQGMADFIYEVEPLNYDEAFQLFNKWAFKQNYPRDDYASLSDSIVKYAQGNPLALEVLGSALNGKTREEWESLLTQLSKIQEKRIKDVLQISYNDLNIVEKDIFLDIACFFKHAGQIYVTKDKVRKIYESSGFDIDITLSVLADRCLVTSKYSLDMHDLLQEMGKEIIQQEAKNSYQRSRLWNPRDIYQIFAGNKEAEAVETITLNLSKIQEMNLNPQVFMRMHNLRFLNFYGESNLHLTQGLDYLPNTLQYLRWEEYPLEYLPPNSLVVVQLPNSNIKQLWNIVKEDSLLSQYDSWRLTSLNLEQTKSITSLPNDRSRFLEALEVLDLRGCSNLNTFPEISINIRKLYLSKTAIKQVPSSSVELLSKLEYLDMVDCRELESLPSNFFSKLTSLCQLDLSGSSRFKMLPEILEATRHSVFLNLSETAIEKLPPFIGICNGRWHINMSKCLKLAFYPRNSENCFSEDILWAESLNLSNCNLRELPEDLSFPSLITFLDLRENDFERIPATFKQLSRLKFLYISDCRRLLSLPELPSNVSKILADNCRSLKDIQSLKQLSLDSPMTIYYFNFSKCWELDKDKCPEVVDALLRNYTRNQNPESLASFEMIYPRSRIPQWVEYQNEGDSIQIYFPSHWFNPLFLGFAFYLFRYDAYCGDDCHKEHMVRDDYHKEHMVRDDCHEEHMVVLVNTPIFRQWVVGHGNFEEDVAVFEKAAGWNAIIKKCGVIPLYTQKYEDELCAKFDSLNLGVSKLKRSATSLEPLHCMLEKRLKIEEIE